MQAVAENRFATATDAPSHGERNAHSVRATESFLRVYQEWSSCRYPSDAAAMHVPATLPVEMLVDRLPKFALEVNRFEATASTFFFNSFSSCL